MASASSASAISTSSMSSSSASSKEYDEGDWYDDPYCAAPLAPEELELAKQIEQELEEAEAIRERAKRMGFSPVGPEVIVRSDTPASQSAKQAPAASSKRAKQKKEPLNIEGKRAEQREREQILKEAKQAIQSVDPDHESQDRKQAAYYVDKCIGPANRDMSSRTRADIIDTCLQLRESHKALMSAPFQPYVIAAYALCTREKTQHRAFISLLRGRVAGEYQRQTTSAMRILSAEITRRNGVQRGPPLEPDLSSRIIEEWEAYAGIFRHHPFYGLLRPIAAELKKLNIESMSHDEATERRVGVVVRHVFEYLICAESDEAEYDTAHAQEELNILRNHDEWQRILGDRDEREWVRITLAQCSAKPAFKFSTTAKAGIAFLNSLVQASRST